MMPSSAPGMGGRSGWPPVAMTMRLGGDALAADIQRVRIDEHRAGVEDRGAGAVQQLAVDALQAGDLAVLGGDQLAPVMRPLVDGPAEAGGVVRPAAVFAGLHQQLLRHAADIDAGAAPEAFLGDADAGAVAGGDARAAHPGRAAADDEQIEVHAVISFFAATKAFHADWKRLGSYLPSDFISLRSLRDSSQVVIALMCGLGNGAARLAA